MTSLIEVNQMLLEINKHDDSFADEKQAILSKSTRKREIAWMQSLIWTPYKREQNVAQSGSRKCPNGIHTIQVVQTNVQDNCYPR